MFKFVEEKVEYTESELFQKLLRGSNKSPTRNIEYSCHVSKKLVMARAFLAQDTKEDDPKNNGNISLLQKTCKYTV